MSGDNFFVLSLIPKPHAAEQVDHDVHSSYMHSPVSDINHVYDILSREYKNTGFIRVFTYMYLNIHHSTTGHKQEDIYIVCSV